MYQVNSAYAGVSKIYFVQPYRDGGLIWSKAYSGVQGGSTKVVTLSFFFFLNGPLIKYYSWDHGLFSGDGFAYCKEQAIANRPVQTDHLTNTITSFGYMRLRENKHF